MSPLKGKKAVTMTALKPEKPAPVKFPDKYRNTDKAGYEFFGNAKDPNGFARKKCKAFMHVPAPVCA
jgi:hypothetical protein